MKRKEREAISNLRTAAPAPAATTGGNQDAGPKTIGDLTKAQMK